MPHIPAFPTCVTRKVFDTILMLQNEPGHQRRALRGVRLGPNAVFQLLAESGVIASEVILSRLALHQLRDFHVFVSNASVFLDSSRKLLLPGQNDWLVRSEAVSIK